MKTLVILRELSLISFSVILCSILVVLGLRLNEPFSIQIKTPEEPLKMQVQPVKFDMGNVRFPPIMLDLSSIPIPDIDLTFPDIPDKWTIRLEGIPSFPETLRVEPETVKVEVSNAVPLEVSGKIDLQGRLESSIPEYLVPSCRRR